jgi:hypothetical protein
VTDAYQSLNTTSHAAPTASQHWRGDVWGSAPASGDGKAAAKPVVPEDVARAVKSAWGHTGAGAGSRRKPCAAAAASSNR